MVGFLDASGVLMSGVPSLKVLSVFPLFVWCKFTFISFIIIIIIIVYLYCAVSIGIYSTAHDNTKYKLEKKYKYYDKPN